MALSSPRFRWSNRLQQVELNNPPMRHGEKGQAVRLIQQCMIDLSINPMTNSIKRCGSPDGIYGRETKVAVDSYQTSKRLSSDGVVGQNTMRALDVDLPNGGGSFASTSYSNQVCGSWVSGCTRSVTAWTH